MAFDVNYYKGIFADTITRNSGRRARELEDHRFYSALNNGQWSATAIERMRDQGRPIITWNFIKKHIDTETGMLLQNPFEFNFDTEFGQESINADLMNELRFRDKDLGKWGIQKSLFTLDMIINTGVMEVFIDRRKDRLGAINFRRRIPTDFHWDPDWRTDNISDNRQIFESGYFDPISIIEKWGDTLDKKIAIKEAVKKWQEERDNIKTDLRGRSVNNINRETHNDLNNISLNLPDEVNGRFLVLQMQELEDIRVEKIFNRANGQFLKETLDDFTEDEDRRIAFQLLQDREGGQLVPLPKMEKKLVVKTIAPGLSREFFLADGAHEVQIGDYNLAVRSAYNQSGQRYGRVEQLKGPQSVFNKSKAIFMHWQTVSPNANKLIGQSAFVSDEEKDRYRRERARGGGNFDVNDATQIVTDERGVPPQDLEQTARAAQEFADRVGAPLAAQAQAKSGVSGILFNAEREQAAVSLELLNDGLQETENIMGEQYIDLALTHYGDDISRSFVSKQTGENIFINTEDKNRIQNMGRLSVRISQAPVGTSVKRENLQIVTQLRQAAQNPLEHASLGLQTIELIPGLNDEVKETMTKDSESVLETARLQNQVLQAQAKAQLQQLGGGEETTMGQQPQAPQDDELQSIIQSLSEESPQPQSQSNELINQ